MALVALAATSACARAQGTATGGGSTPTYPVTGTSLTVALNSSFLEQLRGDGVTVSAVGRALGRSGGAIFTFPVTGGTLSDGNFVGRAIGAGGLVFASASGSVTIDDPVAQLGNGVVTGNVAGGPDSQLLFTAIIGQGVRQGNAIVYRGGAATLSASMADRLNRALGVNVFVDTVVGNVTAVLTIAG